MVVVFIVIAFALMELANLPDLSKLERYNEMRKSPSKLQAIVGLILWLWEWVNFGVWCFTRWVAGASLMLLALAIVAGIVYMFLKG